MKLVILLLLMFPWLSNAGEREVELSDYYCEDANIKQFIDNESVLISSYQGLEEYVKSRLPAWAYQVFEDASKEALKLLEQGQEVEAYAAFNKIVIQGLKKNSKNRDLEGEHFCLREYASFIDTLSYVDKFLDIENTPLDEFLEQNNIDFDVREDSPFVLLMFLTKPHDLSGRGVCADYEQIGANKKPYKITICN